MQPNLKEGFKAHMAVAPAPTAGMAIGFITQISATAAAANANVTHVGFALCLYAAHLSYRRHATKQHAMALSETRNGGLQQA